MSLRNKAALVGISSLAIITRVFAIVHVTVISTLTRQPDTSWLYMWSSVEQCVGQLALSPFGISHSSSTRLTSACSHSRRQPGVVQNPIHTTSLTSEKAKAQHHQRLQECEPRAPFNDSQGSLLGNEVFVTGNHTFTGSTVVYNGHTL